MEILVGFYDQIVLFIVFLFGRFSKGGFVKIYFFVKFSNEIHRFYKILERGTHSCKKYIRYSCFFLLYLILWPTILTLIFFTVKGIFFIVDTVSLEQAGNNILKGDMNVK